MQGLWSRAGCCVTDRARFSPQSVDQGHFDLARIVEVVANLEGDAVVPTGVRARSDFVATEGEGALQQPVAVAVRTAAHVFLPAGAIAARQGDVQDVATVDR